MEQTISHSDKLGHQDTRAGLRFIYLVLGNPAFIRLIQVVLEEIEDLACQVIPSESLEKAVISRRPDLVIVVDDQEFYQKMKQNPVLGSIPAIFAAISSLDDQGRGILRDKDRFWIMKNNPLELAFLIREILNGPELKQVLCVDDSPTVLKQIQKVFSGTPYAVTLAENGLKALEILEHLTPDLILTDVEMPAMDGLTFCHEVRSMPQLSEIPLIIVSSRIDYETVAAGFEAGADEYLTKPFTPDELLNKAESYLAPPPNRRQEHILVVSPNAATTHQLKSAFGQQGFEVTLLAEPSSALTWAKEENPALIVADTDLPGMTGFELCAGIRKIPNTKRTPFVLLTGKTSSGSRKMGQKVGVSAYLVKPFTREGLLTLTERMLAENRSLKALEWDMVLATITSLAKALDGRDPYTRFHSENVSRYAVAIGRKAGLNARELENLGLAGLLHDIGKIGIPDKVLHKPCRLTEEEFELIKTHSRLGADILKPIPHMEPIISGILHHHERIDGQGYPDGLSGDEIPVFAQILAVADTYDALRTDRPYRTGLVASEARRILEEVAGTQLAAKFVRLFLEWIEEFDMPAEENGEEGQKEAQAGEPQAGNGQSEEPRHLRPGL